MGLSAIVRSGVAIANSLTADLQDTVVHEAWTGKDAYDAPTFAAGVSRQALVEMKPGILRTKDGQEILRRAQVTIIGPVSDNGASGRQEPIDPRDRFTLPDGTTGPILAINGLVNPETSRSYLYEVSIG